MFWKIYAWLYLLITTMGYASILMNLAIINMPFKVYESIISLFGIVGIFLYAYNKIWLDKLFWKIFFFMFILIEIKDIPLFIKTNLSLLPNAIVGLVLSIPCYLAIFLYAFKKNEK